MPLLAEQLVEEYLNGQNFFTVRGLKGGVFEIDILGFHPQREKAVHYEVQVSIRPVSYLGKLTKDQQQELGVESANSAKERPPHILQAGMEAWVEKKFNSGKVQNMRENFCPGLDWQYYFVHGKMKDDRELKYMREHGITIIPMTQILQELSERKGITTSGVGRDVVDLISLLEA